MKISLQEFDSLFTKIFNANQIVKSEEKAMILHNTAILSVIERNASEGYNLSDQEIEEHFEQIRLRIKVINTSLDDEEKSKFEKLKLLEKIYKESKASVSKLDDIKNLTTFKKEDLRKIAEIGLHLHFDEEKFRIFDSKIRSEFKDDNDLISKLLEYSQSLYHIIKDEPSTFRYNQSYALSVLYQFSLITEL